MSVETLSIVAAYIRVSTGDQAEFSPDAQLHEIMKYAKQNGYVIPDEYIFREEGISGRDAKNRPAFQRMIGIAKTKPKKFDAILVHRFDRFARNREDSILYKSLLRRDCGIKVISITEDLGEDKMSVVIEAILEAMAEYYSLNLSEEVKKGLFEKARRGERIGKAPYGYTHNNGRLHINPDEAPYVKLIYDYFLSGSIAKTTTYLNTHDIPTKTGGEWTHITVTYILTNPVYAGMVRYNYRKRGRSNYENPKEEWIVSESNHEPIVTQEIFDKVQEKLKKDKELWGRIKKEANLKSWLQHLVKCAGCGSSLVVSSSNKQNKHTFRCYKSRLGTCSHKRSMIIHKVEGLALNKLNNYLNDLQSIRIQKIRTNDSTDELDMLNKQLNRINEKYDLIRRAYLAKIDTIEEYKNSKEALKKEEDEILCKIASIAEPEDTEEFSSIQLENFISLLSDTSIDAEKRNTIAKQFIKEIKFNVYTNEMDFIFYI